MKRGVRLLSIEHVGLQAIDAVHDLGDTTVVVGENATGKTTLVRAIELLVNGRASGVNATPDGIMSLARSDRIVVRGEVDVCGKRAQISRTWARRRDKSVSQDISISTFSSKNHKEKEVWIRDLLGSMPDAFSPEDLISERGKNGGKLRDRLLRLLPRTELSTESIVPADAPAFALPLHADLEPNQWVRYALEKTRTELARKQSLIRDNAVEMGNVEDAWRGEKPTAPIESTLKSLRDELATIGAFVQASAAVARARADLDAAKRKAAPAVAPSESIDVLTERIRVGEQVDDERRADKELRESIRARLAELEQSKIEAGAELSAAHQQSGLVGAVPPSTNESVGELELELAGHERERSRLRGELDGLTKNRPVLATTTAPTMSPIHECPDCGCDLQAFLSTLLAAEAAERRMQFDQSMADHDVEVATVQADLDFFGAIIEETRAALDAANKGVARVAVDAKIAKAETALKQIDAEIALVRASEPPSRSWPTEQDLDVDRFALRLRKAEERDREIAEESIEALNDRLRGAELAAASVKSTGRTVDDVEREIRSTTDELKSCVEWNTRAKRFKEAEEHRALVERQIDGLKEWERRFVAIEASLVARTKDWIETRLSSALGVIATVELVDERGNDDCRFAVDGVYAETLNVGHMQVLLLALVGVLATASEADWKPGLVDEFEHVSFGNRENFLRAAQSMVNAGALSQVIIAGCPDSVPAVEGVKVIRLAGLPSGDLEEAV